MLGSFCLVTVRYFTQSVRKWPCRFGPTCLHKIMCLSLTLEGIEIKKKFSVVGKPIVVFLSFAALYI